MNIVMPMAGKGSRFVEAGFSVPKPLIDVRGKPMYAWATDGLPLTHVKRLIFICLRDHLQGFNLEEDIQTRYEAFQPVVIALDEVTQGQACTVLKAREWIENADPLAIFNADTYCKTTFVDALERWEPSVDGVLDVFQAEGEKWSFARISENDRVVETAEKRRISPWATTGLYYFRRGLDFVNHADAMIARNARVNNEFYVAPVYNAMIASGAEVRANKVSHVWGLGTPEDLASFLHNYLV